MVSGTVAGHLLPRMRRIEHAFLPHELHRELLIAAEELAETARADIGKISERREVEATLCLDFDQSGLNRFVEQRAMEYKSYFAQYVSRIRCYEYAVDIDADVSVRCMQVAYRLLLVSTENEPSVVDLIYQSWRGFLELT